MCFFYIYLAIAFLSIVYLMMIIFYLFITQTIGTPERCFTVNASCSSKWDGNRVDSALPRVDVKRIWNPAVGSFLLSEFQDRSVNNFRTTVNFQCTFTNL